MGDPGENGVDVLLVEDNPGDVRLIEEALRETASTLHTVHNGRDAIDFLHQRSGFSDAPKPDIVLLDLNLPKVDGTTVLDETRREPALEDVRVIVVTTAGVEYTDIDPRDVGEDNFLTKPADPEEFISRVRSRIFDR